MTIDRVDNVTFDYPSPAVREPLGDMSVLKTADGFECAIAIAHRLFHGVSADGKWFVIERNPLDGPPSSMATPTVPPYVRDAVAAYGSATCALQWGAHLYVYVRQANTYRRACISP